MGNDQQVRNMMRLKNIGKRTAERLVSVGIETPEILKKLGIKEVYLRFFEKKGWILHSCFLYALEGAITGERWNEIPNTKKENFKKFSKAVRESLPGRK